VTSTYVWKMDLGTHMLCIRFCPQNRGVTKEKGLEIGSCPHTMIKSFAPSTKMSLNKEEVKKKIPWKSKDHISYTCRGKRHLSLDCPMGNTPKLNLSINSDLLMISQNDTCARKVLTNLSMVRLTFWVGREVS
jgi:hypothetical protein